MYDSPQRIYSASPISVGNHCDNLELSQLNPLSNMPSLPYYRINAFTPSPPTLASGNPAAIVLLPPPHDNLIMCTSALQSLARDINLSETAVVSRASYSTSDFHLRWFTPVAEVDLCGHATLAATRALVAHNWAYPSTSINFHTRFGSLQVKIQEDSSISMIFPALPANNVVNNAEKLEVVAALGLQVERVVQTCMSQYDCVVVVRGEEDVIAVEVDEERLAAMKIFRGVIVTARTGDGGVVSRFFAPGLGIKEDPVTGSAHCVLATLFVEEGDEVHMRQLSERGGEVQVKLLEGGMKVMLSGKARVLVKGVVDVPELVMEEEDDE